MPDTPSSAIDTGAANNMCKASPKSSTIMTRLVGFAMWLAIFYVIFWLAKMFFVSYFSRKPSNTASVAKSNPDGKRVDPEETRQLLATILIRNQIKLSDIEDKQQIHTENINKILQRLEDAPKNDETNENDEKQDEQ